MRLVLVLFALAGCRQAPTSETHDVVTIDAAASQIEIDVRADGTLAMNGRTVKDENALADEARGLAQTTPVIHAVIYVDEGVAYDRVIASMNALKRGGVTHMSFGVRGLAPADASP